MSGTVGETGSIQTVSTTTSTSPVGTESADSGTAVAGGFSTENSISETEGFSSESGQSSVPLDLPGSVPVSDVDLLQQAFTDKLEGVRSVFSIFRSQFASGQIGLSDTQTLLLIFRGMVSDIKTLNNAGTIEDVAIERQSLQSIRQDIAEGQVEINANLVALDAKDLELQENQLHLQSKTSLLTTTSAQLSVAQSADPVDDNLVNTLTAEAVQLQIDVDALQAKIATLNGEIATLSAQGQVRAVRAAELQAQLALSESSEFIVRAFAVAAVKSDRAEELESGEEKLDALKLELKELEKLFSQEQMQVKLEKQMLASLNREVIRESDRYSENLQPRGVAGELKALFTPAALNNLFSLLFARDKPAPSAISPQLPPSEQSVEDAAEALALILLAEPSVTASEEDPVDQPYLGDNLSLEGANNPQAFALLLLKERMSEISEMSEALDKNSGGAVVDSLEGKLLAQLFEAEQRADKLVSEAERDRLRYEAAIPKSHPV